MAKKKINQDDYILTFSKKWTNILLTFGVFWITCSYGLAFMGKTEIAQSLSKSVVTVIIGTFITYSLKAYFETYSEKKNELINKQIDIDNECIETEVENQDIESEG